MKVQVRSGTLDCLDQGSGQAVLLIHAFPLNNTMWASQLGPLSSRYRVIAPNVPGFGQSQPPIPWTMESFADDLADLLDTLGIRECAVAGVSMGGYITLALLSKYPERIQRVVLSNTRARADNEMEQKSRNEMIAALEQNGAAILPDRMLPRLLKVNPSVESVQTVRSIIETTDAYAAICAVSAMRDRPDFSTLLYRMQCPALVIAGAADAIVRTGDSQAMAASIPGSRFVIVPQSGHLSNLENPDEFNRTLLDFMED